MKKIITFVLTTVLLSSCLGISNNGVFNPEKAKDFNLVRSISVKVQMPTEGTRCLIFDEYPFDEHMSITTTPVLIGYSPIDKVLNVPKASKKLYMLANGEVTEFANANIDFQGTPIEAGTRAAGDESMTTITDGLYTYIWNLYPNDMQNIPDTKRQTCTDLVIGEPTNVKISFVVGKNGINNELYWYKYKKNGTNYPSLTDVELHYIITDPGEQTGGSQPEPARGTTIELGDFDEGDYIGFAVKPTEGAYPVYKYSTPAFNQENYPDRNYGTQGIIRKIEYDGVEYLLLGMEDSFGRGSVVGGNDGEQNWADGDFNDMLCLIIANPIDKCKPENPIDPPALDPGQVIETGMWLFEDNYPEQGDYDFNDVVVKYRIIREDGASSAKAYLDFAATGASFHNNFGINGKWIISDGSLTGYKNVRPGQYTETQEVLFEEIPIEEGESYDSEGNVIKVIKFIPMLDNGRFKFDLETYNKHDYNFPNAFRIPSQNFKWCFEGKRIDAAYADYNAWVESGCSDALSGWYLGTVDESLIYTPQ
ncbi:MAG: LruC domain-containing protein [Prevotellaceae bacterium]|jgi:hypothetical protein|nr:LruC domain-containing protein [Prevotellaceae bacterium]